MRRTNLLLSFLAIVFFAIGNELIANIPGGGTGTGANVTITDNGSTVTLANGIVSIIITKSSGSINSINYTYNNSGSTTNNPLLAGGTNGGQLYWLENSGSFLAGPFTETVVANTGDYAEINLSYASPSSGVMEIHYSMLRGSPGFYATPILTHRAQDANIYITLRPNIYAGSQFNWMSVDADRNKLMQVGGGTTAGCPTSPVENYLWTSGIYQGRYEDKYKYSANLASLSACGWSSVGVGGKNVGLWNITASPEYNPGGPMERSLMCHIGTTILNVFTGGYFGLGTDGTLLSGELWGKTYGPYFYYCNNVSSSITDPVQASQALYADALAQGAAEKSAWPYAWFANANYTPAAGRGSVTGKMVIADSGNPNASASDLWVGVIQQPTNNTSVYDFQRWTKPYQFWVKTDVSGNFSIPNVIAGSNYTLYAFGAGAPGTFMSQAQKGGSPPLILSIPATPFAVTVTGAATTALGNVTWIPTRYAPTVFEIGYPDRTARKFRHGDDYWVGDTGPSPTSPSPVWTKFMEYPFDFPNGPNYIVGTSRWTTDWNFIQPAVYSSTAAWNSSTSTITFNLPAGTSLAGNASFYLGLASDYYSAIVVTVNGKNLGSVSGLTATPNASVPTTGYYVGYGDSDTSIREGINGAFSDERLTFPASNLKTGTNTITIGIRQIGGNYFANHAMYDYLRLELANYVPPAPASITASPGNHSLLVRWPAVPGATSYNILRSTTSGSGYTSIATNVTGPVCGSGPENATYLDNTAVNGTPYYYVVQSVNTVGMSGNSTQSAVATPAVTAPGLAPATPAGFTATPASGSVALSWTAPGTASYYTVKRSTLCSNGAGTYNNLGTITLSNNVTGTSYTDTSPTNGSIYSYTVTAINAAGSSADSTPIISNPVAVAPASSPASLTATPGTQQITLNWSAVAGATGYILQVATTPGGPYTYLTSISSLTYTDGGQADNTTYYYIVAATNSGGTSANSNEASATTAPAAPTGLVATAGITQVTLSWTPSTAATSYQIQRGTATGGPYTTVGISPGSTYTDSGLTKGTTYYYVVTATNTGGTSAYSNEVNAIPFAAPPSLTWNGNLNTTWDTTTPNWLNGSISSLYADGSDVTFNDTATTTTVAISGAVSPNSVMVSTAGNYMLSGSGSMSGATTLVKSGSGTLTLSGIHSVAGDISISGGTLSITDTGSGSSAVGAALGTGTVTLSNAGTFRMGSSNGKNFPSNALAVAPASTGTISSAVLSNGFGGAIRGASDSMLTFSGGVSMSVSGSAQCSGFGGTLVIPSGSQLRFSSTSGPNGNGGANTTFQVDGSIITRNSGGTNGVILGALTGGGSLQGQTNTPVGSVVYNIGSKNLDTSFTGMIANSTNGTVAINKLGSGVLTLSGTNTYTGATTVTAGQLSVTGSLAATATTVATTGTLGGSGRIVGAVTCNGTLAPGAPLGTLTLGAGLTLASTSTLNYELGTTSDLIAVTGNLTLDGSVNVTASAGFVSGTYTLITYTGNLINNTLNVGSLPTGCTATVNTATAGQVKLVVNVPRSYSSWVLANFTPAQITAGDSAMDADPAHAGLTNLAKYALGGRPYGFTPQPTAVVSANSLSITFQRPASLNDVTYHAEACSELANWADLALEVLNPGADPETVRATYPFSTSQPRKYFIRLRFVK